MVYCSNCGEKINDDANFCSKCGTKTIKGKAAKVAYPSDEIRDAFYAVGSELEKALNTAARETQAAFRRAREDFLQKPAQTTVCSRCSTKNPSSSVFCYNCGSRITPVKEPDGGA